MCLPGFLPYEMMIIMRYGKQHKAEVRHRIVRAAAAKLRNQGLHGPSVPALMKGAGLTHGGFYAHFHGRDELVAEAVRTAAEETADRVFRAAPDLETVLGSYLSEEHMRNADTGCVVAALGPDGSRNGRRIRSVFAHVAEGLARLVDEKIRRREPDDAISDRALAVTAQMVGAIVLGRLIADPELASRTLRAARDAALRNDDRNETNIAANG